MKGNKLIDDRVQISVNLARLKTHGKLFEIVIEPDKVVQFKQGEAVSIEETLQAQTIFSDAKKGEVATDNDVKEAFGSTECTVVAKQIIEKGEIQFTHKYRQDLREQKYNKVVNLIHRNAMNPQTGLPHPENRIRSAMDEAKVRLNDFKKAEDQLDAVVNLLRPIMPISIASVVLKIHIPATHAARTNGIYRKFGKPLREDWGNDGSLLVELELPAGLQHDCMDELQAVTQGSCELVETKK